MNEKLEQAKKFVKEHKKEVITGVCVVVGGAIVYKITKKKPKVETLVHSTTSYIQITEVPKLDVGKIDDLWFDNYGTNLILNDFTIADMGKIGKELTKIKGITDETEVTAVLGLLDKSK